MQTHELDMIDGFPAIEGKQAKVLILGTMPSVASLQKQQYYGHPRNAFWPIMGALFGATPDMDYVQRKQCLIMHRVAVWDVLKSCYRPGSMDSAIVPDTMTCNDFVTFFQTHPELERVFFNGGTAEKLFRREVLSIFPELGNLSYQRLPSTSPAYASMTLAEKTEAWRVIKA